MEWSAARRKCIRTRSWGFEGRVQRPGGRCRSLFLCFLNFSGFIDRCGVTQSNRDSFHDVSRHLSLSAIIKPCRPRIGMPSQVLHVFKRNALAEQVSDRCNSKRMGRQTLGEPCRFHPPLDHAAHVAARHLAIGDLLCSSNSGAE